MPAVHLLIKGKVQGVFYRATAKDVARKMGLSGWVKNTPEGHVEAMASGEEEKLAAFVAWCRKGPEKAIITSVDITPDPRELDGVFRVLR